MNAIVKRNVRIEVNQDITVQELELIESQKSTAQANNALCQLANCLISQTAEHSARLIELSDTKLYPTTRELLQRAEHEVMAMQHMIVEMSYLNQE